MASIFERAAAVINAAVSAWNAGGRPTEPAAYQPTGDPLRDSAMRLARTIGPQTPGGPQRSTPGTIASDAPYISRFPYIQGPSMDPASVSNALLRMNQGYSAQFCDLLTEQREKVAHLHAVLSTRELAISGCKWRTVPKYIGTSQRSIRQANKINDYVAMRVTEIPQLNSVFQHLAGGIYYPASAGEIEWKRDRFGIGVGHAEGDWCRVDHLEAVEPPKGQAINLQAVLERIRALHKSYGVRKWITDQYAGEPIAQLLRVSGIPVEVQPWGSGYKHTIYITFVQKVRSQRIDMPWSAILDRELIRLQQRTGKSGTVTIGHPAASGETDDLADVCAGLSQDCASQPAGVRRTWTVTPL
jgi:hypothetical protein